jgi:hypothetical protein
MTIESQSNRAQFIGNGVTRDFPLEFPVPATARIRLFLWENNKQTEMTSGFSVIGVGTDYVSVQTQAPIAAGVKLTILRQVPYRQMMDLRNGGDFEAETLEGSADDLELQIQQLVEEVGRAIVAPESMEAGEVRYETLLGLRDEAVAARDGALESEEAAEGAAELAGQSAAAAKDAAGKAGTSANAAKTSETSANASKVAAQTARDQAEEYAALATDAASEAMAKTTILTDCYCAVTRLCAAIVRTKNTVKIIAKMEV